MAEHERQPSLGDWRPEEAYAPPRRHDRPVTTRELAEAFGSSTQFIVEECEEGELKGQSWKVGREWRIRYQAAIAFLAKRNIPAEDLKRESHS